MKQKHIITAAALLLATLGAQAQTAVKGQVVDEKGEPIIGAVVSVPGDEAHNVVTDVDGNYSIAVPKGKKVRIAYLGYITQNVVPGGRTQMQEDLQNLNEVVVVGYGSQKKAHLTGSIATVPMDEIGDLANGNLASSLSGLVNGVNVSGGDGMPGDKASISIRGNAAVSGIINSNNNKRTVSPEPLYVIDGYVYPNDVKVGNTFQNLGAEAFNNLDPTEVESISVLKDAAAAVYGARAANGVILVTTKRGKVGAPRVSYSGTFGFTDEVARPKMLSAYDYGRMYNAVTAAKNYGSTYDHTTELFQADELQAMRGLNYDLLDDNWQAGFTMKHAANISGATEKVNYFGSVSYFDQDGNFDGLDYSRWNYRAGIDAKITNYLSAGITVSGDNGKKNRPYIKVGTSNDNKDYTTLLFRPTYIPEYVGGYPMFGYGISNHKVENDQEYNYSEIRKVGNYSRTMTSNFNIAANVSYDFGWLRPLQGLKAKFSYSKSIANDKTNQYGTSYNLHTMTARYGSGMHMYSPTGSEPLGADGLPMYDYTDVLNFPEGKVANGDDLHRIMTRADNYQMNFTLTYARDFGQHSLSGLFAIEKSEAETEYLRGSVTKPYVFGTQQSSSSAGEESTEFTRYESGALSYVWRANYAYADKYLFEAMLRADSSTKFAPENFWGYFPSFSAGWVASEESWFKEKVKWIDYLKLRGSFGITGRDNTSAWQWMRVYEIGGSNRGEVFGEGTSTDRSNGISIDGRKAAVNRNVHWDKDYKFNIGFDAQFLDRRLAATFDYYHEANREMLVTFDNAGNVPGTIGTGTAATNVGEMNCWGLELSLTWRDKIGKDFKYHVGLNTGYNDNKVLFMPWNTSDHYKQITEGDRTDMGLWGMQCIGMFRSFQDISEYFAVLKASAAASGKTPLYMGLSEDQVRPGMLIYKDIRGDYDEATGQYRGPDGVVGATDEVQLSNRTNPYGMTLNFGGEYKKFSFTAQIGASWGGYTTLPGAAIKPKFNLEYCNMPSFWNPDNMFVYEDIVDGSGNVVMAQNRGAEYPNLAYADVNAVASNFWRVSSARVTLNRLTLAYTLPAAWMKAVGIQSARVNLTGQNLINFYNPYPDRFASPMAGTFGNYPTLRKFTVGVNLSF